MKPFVVTGTGRCGTMWIARTMTELGYQCGHESVFNPGSLSDGSWRERAGNDASWLSLPVLGECGRTVLLQMRSPLETIGSFLEVGMFADPDSHYRKVAALVVDLPRDHMEACMRWWMFVNAHTPSDLRYRVEDVDGPMLKRIADLVDPGNLLTDLHCDRVARRVRRTMNTRGAPSLDAGSIPAALRRELFAAAESLGYRMGEP